MEVCFAVALLRRKLSSLAWLKLYTNLSVNTTFEITIKLQNGYKILPVYYNL